MKKIHLFIFIIFLFSCTKKKTGDENFIIYNNTAYSIDRMEINISNSKHSLSIKPNSVSEQFTINYEYEEGGFLSPLAPSSGPGCGYYISNYSDSTNTYTNNVGHDIVYQDLKKNNQIYITLNPNPFNPSGIFNVQIK